MIRFRTAPRPTLLATFSDLVPCLCDGGLALIFTAFLVLLVQDDSKDSKVLGEQQWQLASYQQRFIGLSEREHHTFAFGLLWLFSRP